MNFVLFAKIINFLFSVKSEFLGDSNNKKQTYDPLAHLPREIREAQPLHVIMRNLECLLLDVPYPDADDSSKNPTTTDEEEKKSDEKNQKEEPTKNENVIIVDDNWMREPAINAKTSRVGKLNRIACMSNSLSAYLISTDSKRNGDHIRHVTSKIYDDVNIWLSRLFRYPFNHPSSTVSYLIHKLKKTYYFLLDSMTHRF